MSHMYLCSLKRLTERFLDNPSVIDAHAARTIKINHIHRCLPQRRQKFPAADQADPGHIQKIRTDALLVYLFFLPIIKEAPFALGGAAVCNKYIHIDRKLNM